MGTRELRPGIHWVGAIDWDRRMFDALIPIGAGTTYNAYLVQGRDKTALVEAVDPAFTDTLLRNLDGLGVTNIDYVIANHAEQDHSGSLPAVLARYPQAQVHATPDCKQLLVDLVHVAEERVTATSDGGKLPLGDRTLRFIHFPWVHWPDTMLTYVEEERVLFSCDLFGSHLAGSDVWPTGDVRAAQEAKRYYACIMMPYREVIERNLPALRELPLELIAPSHGPVIPEPAEILETYRSWISDPPKNLAVIPYISMHDSTRRMVEHLAEALDRRGVGVELFNLADPDIGKLAMSLVDAATVVLGAPTVLGGAHPKAAYAAFLANALRPKTKFASLVGSYGWGGLMAEQLIGLMPDLNLELVDPVVIKGLPREEDLAALDRLADAIARKHEPLGAPSLGAPPELAGESTPAGDAAAKPAAGPALRYRCTRCRWIYDPAQGDPKRGIKPGTPFEDIPEEKWFCPYCGLGKRRFKPLPPAPSPN
jgi:flavorubredoxin/rubredoxin